MPEIPGWLRSARPSTEDEMEMYAAMSEENAREVEGRGGDPKYFRARHADACFRLALVRRPTCGQRARRTPAPRAAARRPGGQRRTRRGSTRAGPPDLGESDAPHLAGAGARGAAAA